MTPSPPHHPKLRGHTDGVQSSYDDRSTNCTGKSASSGFVDDVMTPEDFAHDRARIMCGSSQRRVSLRGDCDAGRRTQSVGGDTSGCTVFSMATS